MIVEICVG